MIGANGLAVGGTGGGGGTGGCGGAGGSGIARGDNARAYGGNGGQAGQPNGNGSRGGDAGGPVHPDAMMQRVELIEKLRAEYLATHEDAPRAYTQSPQQLPEDWINERLRRLGIAWRVRNGRPGQGFWIFTPAAARVTSNP